MWRIEIEIEIEIKPKFLCLYGRKYNAHISNNLLRKKFVEEHQKPWKSPVISGVEEMFDIWFNTSTKWSDAWLWNITIVWSSIAIANGKCYKQVYA